MNRRTMIARLPLLGAAVATSAIALSAGPLPEAEELVAAIIAETDTFRNNNEDEDACDDAVGRALDAGRAVLALPPSARSHPDFLPAVALVRRRWLVMEGSYADPHEADVCLLVDGVLVGTRFDDLPMLWHINGKQFDRRPTDAEFEAACLRKQFVEALSNVPDSALDEVRARLQDIVAEAEAEGAR